MGARGHPGPGPARVPSGLSLHLWEPAFPVCDVGRTILTPPGIKLECCAAAVIDEDGDGHPGDRCGVGIQMWGQACGHNPTAALSRALRVRLLPCCLSRGASQNLTSGRTPILWMRKTDLRQGLVQVVRLQVCRDVACLTLCRTSGNPRGGLAAASPGLLPWILRTW